MARLHGHALVVRVGLDQAHRFSHCIGQFQRLQVQAQFTGRGAAEFEDVVYQIAQVLACVFGQRQPVGHPCLSRCRRMPLRELGEAQDRVQWSAQLVADAGHPARLRLSLRQRRLALAQGLGRTVGLGAVPVQADASHEPSLLIGHRCRMRRDPAHRAVGPLHAEFQLPGRASQQPIGLRGDDFGAVVGVDVARDLVG